MHVAQRFAITFMKWIFIRDFDLKPKSLIWNQFGIQIKITYENSLFVVNYRLHKLFLTIHVKLKQSASMTFKSQHMPVT